MSRITAWLPLFLGGDLLLPFLLAPAYRGYSHLTQTMSALGTAESPWHVLYNVWLIVLGTVMILCSPSLVAVIAEMSEGTAVLLCTAVCGYAAGACILAGIFPAGKTKDLTAVCAKIHGYGSAAGFMVLELVPLLAGLYFFRISVWRAGVISFICLAFSLLCFVLFVMADKPGYKESPVAWEGLWQRLALLGMYIPLVLLCMAADGYEGFAGRPALS